HRPPRSSVQRQHRQLRDHRSTRAVRDLLIRRCPCRPQDERPVACGRQPREYRMARTASRLHTSPGARHRREVRGAYSPAMIERAVSESSASRRTLSRSWAWLWRRLSIGGQHSVRGKVLAVVAWTTTTALLLAGAALLARDVSVYRQGRVAALATEANILALSVTPDLAFDDERSAVRELRALQANQTL